MVEDEKEGGVERGEEKTKGGGGYFFFFAIFENLKKKMIISWHFGGLSTHFVKMGLTKNASGPKMTLGSEK